MDKNTIVKNIMNNYGKYGVTENYVSELIDSGRKQGLSYELIYLELRRQMCELSGEEYYCTAEELASALGISYEQMLQEIDRMIDEVIAAGEDPEEYVRYVPSSKYIL